MDPAGAPPPPIRLVTRLLAAMQTNIVAAGLAAFDGDLDRFVIYTLILRQSLTRPAPDDAALAVRAISVNSLAASLGRPFETVRRHVQALIAAELCVRTADGLIALDTALDRSAMMEGLIVAHDSFVAMVEDWAWLGLPLPAARPELPYRTDVGVNAAVDIMLAVLATNIAAHREWLNLALYSTIHHANVQGFAREREVMLRYPDERHPVPPALLRPVSAAALARALRLPEATVRRRMTALVADGRVERTRGGLLVSQAWLDRPDAVAISRASFHTIRRILGHAAAAGFPFDRPDRAYMRGRPAPVAVETA